MKNLLKIGLVFVLIAVGVLAYDFSTSFEFADGDVTALPASRAVSLPNEVKAEPEETALEEEETAEAENHEDRPMVVVVGNGNPSVPEPVSETMPAPPEPVEPEAEPVILNTVFVGTKSTSFKVVRKDEEGHDTETVSGDIEVVFKGDESASCDLHLTGNLSVQSDKKVVEGAGYSNSTQCLGFIDSSNGIFVLTGHLEGSSNLDGTIAESVRPFNVVGFIEEGIMSGNIAVPGSLDIEFAEK